MVKVEARNEKQSHKRISPYKYFPKQQHCARFSNRHKNKKRQDTQQIIHYQRPLEAHIEAIASSVFLNHILANVPLRQAFKKRKFLANIEEAINELVKDKTLIVVAHRLETIENSDKIVVVDQGKIVAEGTQSELLKNCALYKRLWNETILTSERKRGECNA